MTRATLLLALLAAVEPPSATPFSYRLDEVKTAVYRSPSGAEKDEKRIEVGDPLVAGDQLRTSWRGRAVISVPERAARFEISSSTKVRLTTNEPGVLLVIEKGRLKAIFDALTGTEPIERRVAAPGALLTVRGTRYGFEVDSSGQTSLAVFERVVEVFSTISGVPPIRVPNGNTCTFGPAAPPRPAPMSPGMNARRELGKSPKSGLGDGRRPDATRPGWRSHSGTGIASGARSSHGRFARGRHGRAERLRPEAAPSIRSDHA